MCVRKHICGCLCICRCCLGIYGCVWVDAGPYTPVDVSVCVKTKHQSWVSPFSCPASCCPPPFLLSYMSLCTYVLHMYEHACRGLSLVSVLLSCSLSPYAPGQGLSIRPRAGPLVGFAGHLALGILCFHLLRLEFQTTDTPT